MHRSTTATIATAALLALAGCSSNTIPTSSATTQPATSATATTPQATPSPKPTSCPPTRDVIVWMRIPGSPNAAELHGNYFQRTCQTTFEWVKETSGTDTGDCTEAAWASDNPGYNVDATPAPRLKKVQVSVGPGC
jgi:hypothetical protein